MRNAIGSLGKVFFWVALIFAPAVAEPVRGGTSPAESGPDYDVAVGYTYVSMPIPGAKTIHLNGVDLSGTMDFSPHWGVTLDSSYARTPNVLGTNHFGYLLTAQGGPVFYLIGRGNTRVFVRGLGGMSLVDGAVPISGTRTFHGWQSQFSYAAGGGVEQYVSGPFAVRVNADYLRSDFFDAAGVVKPQNNLRLTVGLVIRLNSLHRRALSR